uniref:AlNc14C217G9032 protein n=1 Tax=Albugo laibachii Nc14 TaxID=890382 RepID=F0WRN4_9STRA|nr:AlNc14C217G9032 [Albugo laibachii Nc14]|eukprot:CCA23998.1 AlNc14C217G9032 [Albugo laibachii Nc14]
MNHSILSESSAYLYPFSSSEKAFEFNQGIDHMPPTQNISAYSILPTSPYFQRLSDYSLPFSLETDSFGVEDLFPSDLTQYVMSDAYSCGERHTTTSYTQNPSQLESQPTTIRCAQKKITHSSSACAPEPSSIDTQPHIRYSGCKRGRPLLYVTASSKRERHNENERQRKQIGEMRETLRLLQEKRNKLLSIQCTKRSNQNVSYRYLWEQYSLLMKKTDLLKEEQFQLGFAVWESRARLIISMSSSKTRSR